MRSVPQLEGLKAKAGNGTADFADFADNKKAPRYSRPSIMPTRVRHAHGVSFNRLGEQGVALVVTLIMLSVITFMAIAFLVLSRGERTSVATATDQSLARLAADNALERV